MFEFSLHILGQWIGILLIAAGLGQLFIFIYNGHVQRVALMQNQLRSNDVFIERIEKVWVKIQDEHLKEQAWKGCRKFRVVHRVEEADGIASFYLKPLDGKALPEYRPGQFLTFAINIPGKSKPVTRCYSLSDAPNSDFYRVTIKRAMAPLENPDAPDGLVSNYFHDELGEGSVLDVKAPSGHFYLDPFGRKPLVLIGAGVGLTPVLSMLMALCKQGTDREIHLFYGVRNSLDHAMEGQLHLLKQRHSNLHIHTSYSQPTVIDIEGEDYDHKGRITTDLLKSVLPHTDYEFYMCGPNPMIDELNETLGDWGVEKNNIHFEKFGPALASLSNEIVKESVGTLKAERTLDDTVMRFPARKPVEKDEQQTIRVKFARSQKEVEWNTGCNNILELAEANGVAMDSGCRSGNCGSCATKLQSGQVNHGGVRAEKGSCLTCVAVPTTSVVVDA